MENILYYGDIARSCLIEQANDDLRSMFAIGEFCFSPMAINRADGFSMSHRFLGTKIPTVLDFSGSFSDAALLAAQDIWKDPRQKALLWSGGADSTVILAALAQTNENWKKDLLIIYSDSCAYPDLLAKMSDAMLVKAEDQSPLNVKWYAGRHLVVDGACGDQLFGMHGRMAQRVSHIFKKPFDCLFDADEFKSLQWSGPALCDYVRLLISKAPIPIMTVADLCWWIVFTHKWDDTKARFVGRVGTVEALNNYKAFFDTPSFQEWSILFNGRNDPAYKFKDDARNFIFDWTKDETYRDSIGKTDSVISGGEVAGLVTDKRWFHSEEVTPELISEFKNA